MSSFDATYDYIIAGAGSSGLSLAWHLVHSPLSEKNILVVDKDLTPKNDKTWCFWHNQPIPFSDIICSSWNRCNISVLDLVVEKPLNEYTYSCIKSGDFRKQILSELKRYPNVELREAAIEQISGNSENALMSTGDKTFEADYIFQSGFMPKELQESKIRYPLIQHFLGWSITTSRPVFDPDSFLLMDIDETFDRGLAFIYLLPWSKRKALIEYTIFSTTI